jgi:hypothetical protein
MATATIARMVGLPGEIADCRLLIADLLRKLNQQFAISNQQ